MTTDNHRSTTLPDVYPRETRALQVTPHPYFTPDNAIVAAVYRDRATGEPIYYPVEVKRKDLLAALGAEPDETDYREVVEENNRLGKNLDHRISEGYRIREALGLSQTASLDEVLGRVRAWALERAPETAPETAPEAPEEPRADQGQIDRSWALERAGEVLGRLAAVSTSPRLDSTIPIIELAWWIVNGPEGDRG